TAPDDETGPLVDEGVPDLSGVLIGGVRRLNHLATKVLGQSLEFVVRNAFARAVFERGGCHVAVLPFSGCGRRDDVDASTHYVVLGPCRIILQLPEHVAEIRRTSLYPRFRIGVQQAVGSSPTCAKNALVSATAHCV